MIDELQLYRGQDYVINRHITVHHPTLSEICTYGEQKYYSMVSKLCATPSDYKVQLFDQFGIDYEEIEEFEFFQMICLGSANSETNIILGTLNLPSFKTVQNQNGEYILYDAVTKTIIDRSIYMLLSSYLRRIHHFEKNSSKAGNEHTKNYLLEKERRQLERRKQEHYHSMLIPLISAMTNCEQFKYNYHTVWDLPIYAFMDCVKRIQKLKNYNYMMQGVYAGNVEFKTLSQESLNWMGSFDHS